MYHSSGREWNGSSGQTWRPADLRQHAEVPHCLNFRMWNYKLEDRCSINKPEEAVRGWINKGVISHINQFILKYMQSNDF